MLSSENGAESAAGGAGGSPSQRLLNLFNGHRLSPTQRRIAQYVLDHLPEAAFLSSVDLAERAGVSQPSVTRFAVALGFAGFPDLRNALRPIVLGAPVDSPEDVRRNEFQAAVADELANLRSMQDHLADPRPIVDLGRELAGSSPLSVLGLRVSAPLAAYFGYCAQRIHPDVRLLTTGGTVVRDALSQARHAGGQWLLAFLLPRYAAESVDALSYARELGMRTAVIADVPLVPFAAEADVVLPAGVGSRLVFDSHATAMMLASVLLQAVADAAPERTQLRLEEYEQTADRFGVFHR